VKHERITSFEPPVSKAAFQLLQVTRELGKRPLAAYDRGYGNAKFVQATEKIEADLLLRLASNRYVWGTPDAYKGRGAPRKHGHKFKVSQRLWVIFSCLLFIAAKCQLVQTQVA
jgi:hypothetical protein